MEAQLLNEIKAIVLNLQATIADLKNPRLDFPENSPETNEICTALAKAQGEFKVAEMKGINAFHKAPYEDLKELIRVTREALAKNGLSVTFTECSYKDQPNVLHVYLRHTSSQFFASHVLLTPPKNTLEAIKSYKDAIKRMAYNDILCIATGNDDDDGEGAMWDSRETMAKGAALNRGRNSKDESTQTINGDQIHELEKAFGGNKEDIEYLLDTYHYRTLADIKVSEFPEILTTQLRFNDRRAKAK
jgi:hypothetical protein